MTLQHTRLTGLPNARHRLAALRNRLHAELANLKSGSTAYKTTKGRMGGVMDAIEICDQELLAEEQGRAQHLGRLEREALQAEEQGKAYYPSSHYAYPPGTNLPAWEWSEKAGKELTADQLAWPAKRKGDA